MITYTPLWETMKHRKMTKYKLVHKHGIAQITISRMTKNMPTSSETINDLCRILDCNVQDIMRYEKDQAEDN